MTIPRPCIGTHLKPGCPMLARGGPRCIECEKVYQSFRNRRPERAVYRDPAYRATVLYGPCAHCGSWDDPTKDHIVPVSRGGRNDAANLQVLCRPCNSRKHDRLTTPGWVESSTVS